MVHISRWDELRIFAANLVRTIHFFNPVAWLAVIELGQAREERCDEVVVRTGVVAARDYRRSLVDILRLNQLGHLSVDALVGLVDRKEGIKMRVVSIQNEALPRNLRPWWVALGAILAAVLLVPMAPAERPATASQNPSQESGSEVAIQKGWVTVGFFGQPGVLLPIRIEGADPKYTDLTLAEGTDGSVKLDVTVGVDGAVKNVQVVQGQPHGLTEAAVDAVRKWRFQPAHREGDDIPIELTMLAAVVFQLYDGEPRHLDANLVAEIEPLLPAGVTLTSLTTDGALLRLGGLSDGTDQVGELLANLEDSSSFTRTDLESVSRKEGGFEFRMICERVN